MSEGKRQELIACHDCGGRVSFSAVACPHCGSREPAGPYEMSERERRLFRAEQENDRTLLAVTVLCTGIGVFYGAVMGTMLTAIGFGLVGAMIGPPAGFIINMSRRFLRQADGQSHRL
jgi:hypothetical protein